MIDKTFKDEYQQVTVEEESTKKRKLKRDEKQLKNIYAKERKNK
jgi:hypothetical protein